MIIENKPTTKLYKDMKVKTELRPEARKIINKLVESGEISRSRASDYRRQIKYGSKNTILNLMTSLEENMIYTEDESGSSQGNGESQGNGVSQPRPFPEGNTLPMEQGAQSPQVKNGDKQEQRIDGLEQKVDNIAEMISQGMLGAQQGNQQNQAIQSEEIRHWQFDRVKLLLETNKLALCVGEAGTGKTHMAEQLSKDLNCKQFHALSLTSGMSEAHLTGRMNVMGEFIDTEFLNIVENGGFLLLDEFDNGDPDVMNGLNSLLSNGFISVPLRKDNELALLHDDTYILCTANTWGGSNSSGGSGYVRKQIDLATLNRFTCSKAYVGFDSHINNYLMGLPRDESIKYPKPTKLTKADMLDILPSIKEMQRIFTQVRKYIMCENMQLRQLCSQRAFIQGSLLVRQGWTPTEVLRTYLLDWSDDELKRIGARRDKSREENGIISVKISMTKFWNGLNDGNGDDNE